MSVIISHTVIDRDLGNNFGYNLRLWWQASCLNWDIPDQSSSSSSTCSTQPVSVYINDQFVKYLPIGEGFTTGISIGDKIYVTEDPIPPTSTTPGAITRSIGSLSETAFFIPPTDPVSLVSPFEGAIKVSCNDPLVIFQDVSGVCWATGFSSEPVIPPPTTQPKPLKRYRATMTFGNLNNYFIGVVQALAPVILGPLNQVDIVYVDGNNIIVEWTVIHDLDTTQVAVSPLTAKLIAGALITLGAVLIAFKIEEIVESVVVAQIINNPDLTAAQKQELIDNYLGREKGLGDPLALLGMAIPLIIGLAVISFIPKRRQ